NAVRRRPTPSAWTCRRQYRASRRAASSRAGRSGLASACRKRPVSRRTIGRGSLPNRAKWLLRPPMCFAVTLEYRIGTATLENLERNPATLSGGGQIEEQRRDLSSVRA